MLVGVGYAPAGSRGRRGAHMPLRGLPAEGVPRIASPGKDQNSEFEVVFTECVLFLHTCEVKNWKSNRHKSGPVYT